MPSVLVCVCTYPNDRYATARYNSETLGLCGANGL